MTLLHGVSQLVSQNTRNDSSDHLLLEPHKMKEMRDSVVMFQL
jgi:hypothetical protein